LLVRRPIFDEMKKNMGEAYVEELISVRSDAEYDVFDTTFNPDGTDQQSIETQDQDKLNPEEVEKFKEFIEDLGDI
jgi:hypothetical protein